MFDNDPRLQRPKMREYNSPSQNEIAIQMIKSFDKRLEVILKNIKHSPEQLLKLLEFLDKEVYSKGEENEQS